MYYRFGRDDCVGLKGPLTEVAEWRIEQATLHWEPLCSPATDNGVVGFIAFPDDAMDPGKTVDALIAAGMQLHPPAVRGRAVQFTGSKDWVSVEDKIGMLKTYNTKVSTQSSVIGRVVGVLRIRVRGYKA